MGHTRRGFLTVLHWGRVKNFLKKRLIRDEIEKRGETESNEWERIVGTVN